jgi:hypothetical protein
MKLIKLEKLFETSVQIIRHLPALVTASRRCARSNCRAIDLVAGSAFMGYSACVGQCHPDMFAVPSLGRSGCSFRILLR